MNFKYNVHSDWLMRILKMLTMLSFALKMKFVLKIRR